MNTKKLLLAACAALFASVGAFAIDAPGGLTASDGTSSEKIEISWNEVAPIPTSSRATARASMRQAAPSGR